ncbi:MAG: hypothetical protein HOV80_29100 [Polyangiaceae bacterium]|nr:hypothetical protein [Polyangiaceae bacterium]
MRLALAVLVGALLVFLTANLRADEYVIEEEREADVQALFEPYRLGAEVSPGWRLWTISIEPTQIVVGLQGPEQARAELTLVHHAARGASAERTASFAVDLGAAPVPAAATAQRELVAALRKNDDGRFWRAIRPLPVGRGQGSGTPLFGRLLAFDGLVLLVGLFAIVIALAVRLLWVAPRWVKWAVPAATLAGLLLRVALAPPALLGAWPWSRTSPHVRTLFESRLFDALARDAGHVVYMTDLSLDVGLFYAALTPLVLFSHATQLLRDARAGAFVAFAVAFSPHHIRFSRCEDAFVPSIVLTSTAFALLHTLLRERSRSFRIVAGLLLPIVLWPAYLLRPLNILFLGIYLFAASVLHPDEAPRGRRVLAIGIVGIVGVLAVAEFFSVHGTTIGDATTSSGQWLLGVPQVLISPDLNLLLQPAFTPPVILVAAGVGVWALFRRGQRRLAWFLIVWLSAFFVTHAYVVDAAMQPRYHLHLLVPTLLLAAVGALEIAKRSRPAIGLLCGTAIVTPFLARNAIADVGSADTREYSFVRSIRDTIPEDCAVIEYIGDENAKDARFGRIGLRTGAPTHQRFRSVAVTRADGPNALVDAVRHENDGCVFVYEGLACWGGKDPSEPYAPACAALDAMKLPSVAEEHVPARVYERRVLEGLGTGQGSLRLRMMRRAE